MIGGPGSGAGVGVGVGVVAGVGVGVGVVAGVGVSGVGVGVVTGVGVVSGVAAPATCCGQTGQELLLLLLLQQRPDPDTDGHLGRLPLLPPDRLGQGGHGRAGQHGQHGAGHAGSPVSVQLLVAVPLGHQARHSNTVAVAVAWLWLQFCLPQYWRSLARPVYSCTVTGKFVLHQPGESGCRAWP